MRREGVLVKNREVTEQYESMAKFTKNTGEGWLSCNQHQGEVNTLWKRLNNRRYP